MAVVKEMFNIEQQISEEFYIFDFSKYEQLLESLENCTKKLDILVEKTSAIEQQTQQTGKRNK